MAANNRGIQIGVFDSSISENNVPDQYIGKQIWYSTEQKFFLLVDNDRNIIKKFDLDDFEEFYNKNVIVYTSQGVKTLMEKELLNWHRQQETQQADMFADADPFASGDPFADPYGGNMQDTGMMQYDAYQPHSNGVGEYEYNTSQVGRRVGNRRDALNTGVNALEDDGKKVKDPSKHLFAFCVVTFIMAVVAFVVLNFAEPIITAIAPLLS